MRHPLSRYQTPSADPSLPIALARTRRRRDMDARGEARFLSLPDEVLVHAMSLLRLPKDLASAESSCKRLRCCVREGVLWKRLVESMSCSTLASYCREETDARRMVRCLQRSERTQLAAEVIRCSSVDRPEEEDARNVLLHHGATPPGSFVRYWSSSGTPPEDALLDPDVLSNVRERSKSMEWIELRLSAPIALLEAIQLQAFKATFQDGHPIYAPSETRLLTSVPSKMDVHGYEDWEAYDEERGIEGWDVCIDWTPVDRTDHIQALTCSTRMACVGGRVRVDMCGKPQRQDVDGLHYMCLSRLRLLGRAVRGVRLVEGCEGWRLAFDALDEVLVGDEKSMGAAWWEEKEAEPSIWEEWRSDGEEEESLEEMMHDAWLLPFILGRQEPTDWQD